MEGWDHVRTIPMPKVKGKPDLTVPLLEEWVRPINDDFIEEYGSPFTGKRHRALNDNKTAGATIDLESYRDFDKPNMFGFKIWWTSSETEKFTVGADKSKWGWKRCAGHIKCKKKEKLEACPTCKRVKPKNHGKVKTRPIPGSRKFHTINGWVHPEQVETIMVPLFMNHGVRTCWAHNATVELIGLMSVMFPKINHPLHYYLQNPKDRARILFKGSGILTASIDLAEIYNRHHEQPYMWHQWNTKTKKIEEQYDYWLELRDSTALMPVPLATIGKALGYPKGKTPTKFTDKDDPDFGDVMKIVDSDVEYCIRDNEILWRGLQDYWRVFKEMGYQGRDLPLTVTGLGFQMIAYDNVHSGDPNRQHMFVKKERSWRFISKTNQPELDDICRKAFVGGRTQVFRNTPYIGPALGSDANSMYPSQLISNNPMPDYREMCLIEKVDGSLHNCIINGTDTDDDVVHIEGVVNVHWVRPDSDKVGLLSHRSEDGSLSWTHTEGTRWITLPEYRVAHAAGYRLTIVKDEEVGGCMVVMPRLKANLFPMVEKIYAERKRRKAAGDGTEFYLKIWLNGASFGAWATRVQDTMLTTEEDAVWADDDYVFKPVSKVKGETIGYLQEEEKHRTDRTANIMAAYITAYARIDLYRAALEIGADRLLYCDTDSWKYIGEDEECYREGSELGEWKIEQRYDYWHSVAPKQYRYRATWDEDKGSIPEGDGWNARIKGVSLKMAANQVAKELDKDSEGFWNEFVRDHLDITGAITFDRVMSIKETLWQVGKESAHTAGSWKTVTKVVNPDPEEKKRILKEVKQCQ